MDAPGIEWHREGKAAVLAALASLGIEGRDTVDGVTPNGTKWKADVLFSSSGRSIAIQLQRAYQPLREFRRRQERFAECGIDCFWLFRDEPFAMLTANIAHVKSVGALPELPVAMLNTGVIHFGDSTSASVSAWLSAIIDGSFQYRDGRWNLSAGDRSASSETRDARSAMSRDT